MPLEWNLYVCIASLQIGFLIFRAFIFNITFGMHADGGRREISAQICVISHAFFRMWNGFSTFNFPFIPFEGCTKDPSNGFYNVHKIRRDIEFFNQLYVVNGNHISMVLDCDLDKSSNDTFHKDVSPLFLACMHLVEENIEYYDANIFYTIAILDICIFLLFVCFLLAHHSQ